MKKTSPKMHRLTAVVGSAALACVLWGTPAPAHAALYKYQTPDGKVLITTEKMPGYKLLEVLSGPHKATPSRPTVAKHRSQHSAAHSSGARKRKSTRKGKDAFDDIIVEASDAYDVPFGFIKAVIHIESAFNPNAVSRSGAQGLMQLMPRTAASLNVTDAFNPRQNIYGGAKFLRILIDRYDGDINLILAAYNAGDAAVSRYDGIPYPQTRAYVASDYYWYKVYDSKQESQ